MSSFGNKRGIGTLPSRPVLTLTDALHGEVLVADRTPCILNWYRVPAASPLTVKPVP